jgi:hypothetical protein
MAAKQLDTKTLFLFKKPNVLRNHTDEENRRRALRWKKTGGVHFLGNQKA